MDITIRIRGPIAKRLNNSVYTIDIGKEISVCEILQLFIEREKDVKEIWSTPKRLDCESMILVNDADIGLIGGLNASLKEGDVLTILPLVHGG